MSLAACVIVMTSTVNPADKAAFKLDIECDKLDFEVVACGVGQRQMAPGKFAAVCVNTKTGEVVYEGSAERVQET